MGKFDQVCSLNLERHQQFLFYRFNDNQVPKNKLGWWHQTRLNPTHFSVSATMLPTILVDAKAIFKKSDCIYWSQQRVSQCTF